MFAIAKRGYVKSSNVWQIQQGAAIGIWIYKGVIKNYLTLSNFLFLNFQKNSALGKYPANYKILLETL